MRRYLLAAFLSALPVTAFAGGVASLNGSEGPFMAQCCAAGVAGEGSIAGGGSGHSWGGAMSAGHAGAGFSGDLAARGFTSQKGFGSSSGHAFEGFAADDQFLAVGR